MRVIAGEARSLQLQAPKGMAVRPTTDRTKETLFNILSPSIFGCVFLDIFSGSGAIGIEALSRGAKEAVFIEQAHESITCIEKNLLHTKLFSRGKLLKMDALKGLQAFSEQFGQADIVFLDPPYNKGLEERVIREIHRLQLLTKNGLIVCESAEETDFDFVQSLEGLQVQKVKSFKTNKFTFIEGNSI